MVVLGMEMRYYWRQKNFVQSMQIMKVYTFPFHEIFFSCQLRRSKFLNYLGVSYQTVSGFTLKRYLIASKV